MQVKSMFNQVFDDISKMFKPDPTLAILECIVYDFLIPTTYLKRKRTKTL